MLSVFKSVFVLILTYSHEYRIMAERILPLAQAAEMGLFRRVHAVKCREKVLSCEVRKALNIEPLLLQLTGSQLRWFGHMSRISRE